MSTVLQALESADLPTCFRQTLGGSILGQGDPISSPGDCPCPQKSLLQSVVSTLEKYFPFPAENQKLHALGILLGSGSPPSTPVPIFG